MQHFDDRTSTMTIYTLSSPTKRPSRRDYETAPPILMDPACRFHFPPSCTDLENFVNRTNAAGYAVALGPEFIRDGIITCSDPERQVAPGLLYLCLIGQSEYHINDDPNDYIYRPEHIKAYSILDYRPSPHDLPWKPYRVKFNLQEFQIDFMALDQNQQIQTAILSCPKLAFHFEFEITYPKLNQCEKYICEWSPTKSYGPRAPFSITYELFFDIGKFNCGIARRTIRYESYPGLRPAQPTQQLRVYGTEVHAQS